MSIELGDAPGTANAKAVSAMWRILQLIGERPWPYRIAASVEGGIAISWHGPGKKANIECFNTGEVLACVHNELPDVWEVTDDASTLEKIYHYLSAPSAGEATCPAV